MGRKLAAAIKSIYTATSAETAQAELDAFDGGNFCPMGLARLQRRGREHSSVTELMNCALISVQY